MIVKPDGHCDLADSLAMLRALAGQRRERGVAGALLDLRQIDYTPTYREAQTLADEAGREVCMPLALVVAGKLHTGIAHQFAAFCDALGPRVGVFAAPEAATDWLRANE